MESKQTAAVVETVVIEVTMPARAHTVYGAPATVYTTLTFPAGSAAIDVGLQWIGTPPYYASSCMIVLSPVALCIYKRSLCGILYAELYLALLLLRSCSMQPYSTHPQTTYCAVLHCTASVSASTIPVQSPLIMITLNSVV